MAREDRRPVEPRPAVEVEAELRRFAGEHRLGAADADRHARQIARGVHHPGEPQAGEEKGEREAERQRVVDRADKENAERRGEQPAEARRHDIDAAMDQHHGAVLGRREAVEPVGEARMALEQRADHAVGPSYFQRPCQAARTMFGYSARPRLPL